MASLLVNKLKEKIQNENLTAAEVDRLAGLAQGTVRKIIIGDTKNPGIETISAISKVLHCNIDSFISYHGNDDSFQNIRGNDIINLPLYKECVSFSCDFLLHDKKDVKFGAFLSAVNEIYAYSMTKEETTIDLTFAKWLLKKQISN